MQNTRRGLVKEQVDLEKMPAFDQSLLADNGAEITIGDLHGNFLKLLFFLVKHGIITNITSDDYAKLTEIYNAKPDTLNAENLAEFNAILNKLEINNAATLRLIGDDLGDRGSNDYFTLKMIAKLRQANVSVNILMSNHTIEFVKARERNLSLAESELGYHQATSMYHLQKLIDAKLVTRDEINQLYDEIYKPNFKLIDYSLNGDNEITLYTHAGVGLEVIEGFAKKFGVTYNDDTTRDLAATIAAVDDKFQEYVKSNTICSLYVNEKKADSINTPFEKLLWHRAFQFRNYVAKCPTEQKGYQLNYVHGHDIYHNEEDKHIFNLDNNLGKVVWSNKNPRGEYSIFYTHDHNLKIKNVTAPTPHAIAEPIWATLETKIIDLKTRGFETESALLTTFKTSLQSIVKEYQTGQLSPELFTVSCKVEFNKIYQSRLATHRGMKETLLNIAIMFASFGIAGLVNLIRTNNQSFFFKFDTDTISKTRTLETQICNAPSPMVI